MKHCPACEQDLELSEYGVDNSRDNGLNLYCKVCIRRKITEGRMKRRVYAQAHKLHRKPCRAAEPLWRKNLSPRTKVILAIERGEQSQRGIQAVTRLSIDQVTDILAELWNEGMLDRRGLRNRVYRLAA